MPLLPCAPHAPTGEPVRDLPSGVSGRAAGSREGAAGPGDVAPARVGQAGGSGVWAAFWARLRAAAALRASRLACIAFAALRACAERSSGVWRSVRAAVALAAFSRAATIFAGLLERPRAANTWDFVGAMLGSLPQRGRAWKYLLTASQPLCSIHS